MFKMSYQAKDIFRVWGEDLPPAQNKYKLSFIENDEVIFDCEGEVRNIITEQNRNSTKVKFNFCGVERNYSLKVCVIICKKTEEIKNRSYVHIHNTSGINLVSQKNTRFVNIYNSYQDSESCAVESIKQEHDIILDDLSEPVRFPMKNAATYYDM